LQQPDGLSHVVLVHFCPLGQLVQVACFAAFLTGGTFANIDAQAITIANALKLIFFI